MPQMSGSSERGDRIFRIITESPVQARQEVSDLKVVKHLPEGQQQAVRNLVGELIRAERFASDPILDPENNRAFFVNAMIYLRRAIEAEVPREVLLAVLDRDFLQFKPANGHVNAG